jgi:colicin import membrane protein
MSHRRFRSCLAAALLTAGLLPMASAQDVDPGGRERQRIDAERAAAARRYDERLHACEGRFALTACVDEAKRERRDTLTRLKHEQNRLDDARRKARAAERTETLRQRAAAEAQRTREAASSRAETRGTPRRNRGSASQSRPHPSNVRCRRRARRRHDRHRRRTP